MCFVSVNEPPVLLILEDLCAKCSLAKLPIEIRPMDTLGDLGPLSFPE